MALGKRRKGIILKITKVKSIYPGQHPVSPSLSHCFSWWHYVLRGWISQLPPNGNTYYVCVRHKSLVVALDECYKWWLLFLIDASSYCHLQQFCSGLSLPG